MQVKRSIVLLASTVLGMLCLLMTNKFITSVLSSSDFGSFSYALNFFNLVQITTSFGVFYPLSRELAKSNINREIRNILGLGYFFVFCIFLLQLVVVISSYYIYFLPQKPEIALTILCVLPLTWIFSANNLSEVLFQSLNSVKYLAAYRFLPRFIFLLLVYLLIVFYEKKISLSLLLYSFLISYSIVHIGSFFAIKPKFTRLKNKCKDFFNFDFSFGFNVYTGSLISLGAVSFTGLLIGFFQENSSEVGYYNLAIQLSVPLTLLPNVIATSNYSKFVNNKCIGNNVLFSVVLICLSSLVMMFILSDFIVDFIYGSSYRRVSEINKILIIGYFFYGIADCYNKFLLAKGYGKEIRNTSIIIGVFLLLSNFLLIPKFSSVGAAISVIIAGIVYLFFSMYFYYSRKKSF